MADTKTAFVYVLVSRNIVASATFKYLNTVESIWLTEDSARKALAEFAKTSGGCFIECAFVNRVPVDSPNMMHRILGSETAIARVDFPQPTKIARVDPPQPTAINPSGRAAHTETP